MSLSRILSCGRFGPAIDDSTYLWQGDKVYFEPHYYSHQPPMMAMVGALPFWVMSRAGLAIDDPLSYRLLTWLLVGLPTLFGLWALSRLIAAAGCTPRWNAFLVGTVGLATMVLPYALVLNQHGAAAGARGRTVGGGGCRRRDR